MMRKTVLALSAIALIGMLLPTIASARGGFGGGASRGAGFAHGSGWRGAGWRGPAYGARGIGLGIGVGLGLAGGYDGYPYSEVDGYPIGYGEYAEYGPWAYSGYYAGCYLARQRLWTPYGWRLRAVRSCG
jgi:hypothetical protein